MDFIWFIETLGEPQTVAAAGLVIGIVFGFCAQRSQFCLRAAAVEFFRGSLGSRVAVWLLAFSTALFWVQTLVYTDLIELSDARMLAVGGSISGAILGGLMFGVGMVLARGCSGRLLVLAATGNLRALLSGLVFAVAAQMALRGALEPVRSSLAGIWTTGPSNINMIEAMQAGPGTGIAFATCCAVVALVIAYRNRVSFWTLTGGAGVGACVAAGWAATYALSAQTFEPTQVESITFSGPSADTLMFLLAPDLAVLDFDIGLVPGVAIGAFVAAWLFGELRLQGFEGAQSMRRYLLGAVLMGFGAMLAGGCAIGAGVTGGSIFVLTAWIALTFMWIGAGASDLIVDRGWRPTASELLPDTNEKAAPEGRPN